jgi:hypothetical protein
MRASVTVSQSGDISAIGAAIADLKDASVLVGIPEKETDRKRGMIGPQKSAYITNAGLLYIHTNGSQLHKIPPRPVIEPAIDANRLRIESLLFQAAQARIDGKKAESNRFIKMTGQFASNACKLWFRDPRNGWAQNAPDTIRRKLGKKPRSRKAAKTWLSARAILDVVNATGVYMPTFGTTALDSINSPLINTAQLRRAITYVVNKP